MLFFQTCTLKESNQTIVDFGLEFKESFDRKFQSGN